VREVQCLLSLFRNGLPSEYTISIIPTFFDLPVIDARRLVAVKTLRDSMLSEINSLPKPIWATDYELST
jgi:hypothetical protein